MAWLCRLKQPCSISARLWRPSVETARSLASGPCTWLYKALSDARIGLFLETVLSSVPRKLCLDWGRGGDVRPPLPHRTPPPQLHILNLYYLHTVQCRRGHTFNFDFFFHVETKSLYKINNSVGSPVLRWMAVISVNGLFGSAWSTTWAQFSKCAKYKCMVTKNLLLSLYFQFVLTQPKQHPCCHVSLNIVTKKHQLKQNMQYQLELYYLISPQCVCFWLVGFQIQISPFLSK